MKARTYEAPKGTFKPIVVEITLESPYEMLAIKALLEHGAGGRFSVPAQAGDLMKPLAAELAPFFTPL